MTRGKAKQLRALIEALSASLSDETALTGVELFPPWSVGKSYATGDRVQYEGTLYKCVQGHTSQADWTPPVTPALWTAVSIDEYPAWVQPTGAHDAYSKGDKVTHSGKHWASDVDNNTWEPGVYGWTEVTASN